MTEAEQNKDQNFAVLSAMLKAGMKQKSKLSATEYARRLAVEKALQQRRYCDAFALWRSCAHRERVPKRSNSPPTNPHAAV